jgi:hypothetical protein
MQGDRAVGTGFDAPATTVAFVVFDDDDAVFRLDQRVSGTCGHTGGVVAEAAGHRCVYELIEAQHFYAGTAGVKRVLAF